MRADDPGGLGTDAQVTPLVDIVFGPVRRALWCLAGDYTGELSRAFLFRWMDRLT
jgi:hypothetical protein